MSSFLKHRFWPTYAKCRSGRTYPISDAFAVSSAGCKFNLDVEMETGTGKTYCYIKSIFELNQRYGW